MEVGSLTFSSNHYSGDEFAENLSNDFGSKLKVKEVGFDNLPENEQWQSNEQEPEEGKDEGEEEEEDEEDFSFVCLNPDGSLISADEAFYNGQIRPAFPLFNQDLLFADDDESLLKTVDGSTPLRPPLRKLFVEGRDSTSSPSDLEVPPSNLSGRNVQDISPNACNKSNSTGFSKLWRFRDLVHRSKSDGKDAFVFLNHASTSKSPAKKTEKNEKAEKKGKAKVNGEKGKAKKLKLKEKKTAGSAAEKHYMEGRAIREVEKRKSYLPYRRDLVGFFTSVNGFSRNVHPF
ncbi:hypothetical protein SLEP1_g25376 [Rubroshorea leprosula]|uniref:Uncharacterized protein n=1 Tax=Rubroshorea leprosula TaxID=152421 RepID=A0AAV5JT67_9ROSI|nr:hypothetical protein SLEP1_g25376 [Rubroshorea leprosula]